MLTDPVVQERLDFTKPIVMLQVGTLHHLEGDRGPDVMREYVDALASGSYVVFSHFLDPEVPELTAVASGGRTGPGSPRSAPPPGASRGSSPGSHDRRV